MGQGQGEGIFILWSERKLIMICLTLSSPCYEQQPGRSHHQEHE
jgi:hypothetical protein